MPDKEPDKYFCANIEALIPDYLARRLNLPPSFVPLSLDITLKLSSFVLVWGADKVIRHRMNHCFAMLTKTFSYRSVLLRMCRDSYDRDHRHSSAVLPERSIP